MKQELEFGKAQQCINAAKELIDNYSNNVDNVISMFKCKNVNLFIAGSKSLQQERDIFAGVVNVLQSKWKPLGIDVNSYSYQNFPREVTDIPSQKQYNNFIAKQRQFNKVNTEFSKKTTTLLKQLSDDYIQTREEIHKMNSKIDRLTVFLILTLCLLLWSVFI